MLRAPTISPYEEEIIMELYTLAGAAELLGCTPNRIKSWMDKGFIPEMRIHLGKIKARVIDDRTVEKIQEALKAMADEGLTVRGAFERYFPREEVMKS
jgi:hypothetical protein